MSTPFPFACKLAGIVISGLLLFTLTACTTSGSTKASGPSTTVTAQKTPAGPPGQIAEFTIPVTESSSQFSFPIAITSGPDNNLWFTEAGTSLDQNQPTSQSFIGRVTPVGKVTLFPIPTTNVLPTGITKGPDGNLWFTEGATISSIVLTILPKSDLSLLKGISTSFSCRRLASTLS